MNTKSYSRVVKGLTSLLLSIGFLIWLSPPLSARDFQVLYDLRVDGNVNTPYGGIGRYQNLLTYSDTFDNDVVWVKTNVSAVTADQITAPDGSITAEALTPATAAATNVKNTSGTTAAASISYTFSLWLKAASGTKDIVLTIGDTATNNTVTASLTTTWQRFSVTYTSSASPTGNVFVQIGNASWTLGTIHAWGAQLEQSSSPGVYAKTTSGTVAASRGIVSTGDILMPSLKLSGGQITDTTGTVTVGSNLASTGNLQVTGAGPHYIQSGNVGIGTTGPGATLDVTGTFEVLSSTSGNATYLRNSGTGNALVVNQQSTGDIVQFQDGSSPVMVIKDGGNIGIGMTNPSEQLELTGNLKFTGAASIKSGGALTIGDNSTAVNINSSGTVSFASGVAVSGALSTTGAISINGTTLADSSANISGDRISELVTARTTYDTLNDRINGITANYSSVISNAALVSGNFTTTTNVNTTNTTAYYNSIMGSIQNDHSAWSRGVPTTGYAYGGTSGGGAPMGGQVIYGNKLYHVSWSYGVKVFNLDTNTIANEWWTGSTPALPYNYWHSLAYDPVRNDIYVGNYSGYGLVKIDIDANTVTAYTTSNSTIKHNGAGGYNYNNTMQYYNGKIYLWPYDNYMQVFDVVNQTFTDYGSAAGLPYRAYHVAISGNKLHISGEGGFYIWNMDTNTLEKRFWTGGTAGQNQLYNYTNTVYSSYEDPTDSDKVWLGTYYSFQKISKATGYVSGTFHRTDTETGQPNYCWSIARIGDQIWLGSQYGSSPKGYLVYDLNALNYFIISDTGKQIGNEEYTGDYNFAPLQYNGYYYFPVYWNWVNKTQLIYESSNVFESNAIITSAQNITSAKFNFTGAAGTGNTLTWYLSANNGANWEGPVSTNSLWAFTNPGTQLKIKVTMSAGTGTTPVVRGVTAVSYTGATWAGQGSTTVETEVLQARNSTAFGTFGSVDLRLEDLDSRLSGKSDTSHNHSGTYLLLTGGSLSGALTINANVNTNNVLPNSNNAYDLGSNSNKWKDAYITGNIYAPGNGIWKSTGNVGIGTTTPIAKLDVVGGAIRGDSGLTISGTVSLPDNSITNDMVVDTLTASDLVTSTSVVSDAEVDDNITLTNITQITNKSHTSLTDIGTNTHLQIDTHIANTSNPHSVTKAQVGLGNVDNIQQMPLSYLSTSTTLGTSDALVPSQNAAKVYVDNAIAGLKWKQSVRVGTTAAGTLATSFFNGQSVDGITLVTGDRILIKDQSDGTENGIYIVNASSGNPTRAADADTGSELLQTAVFIEEGTQNADTAWVCNTNGTITLPSTALSFTQFTGAAAYTWGTGLSNSGNTINVNAGIGIDVDDTNVSHEDLSAQATVDNSLGTVIQDVTMDTLGHVTGLASVDLDGRYFTETEANTNFVNISGDTMTGLLTVNDNDGVDNENLAVIGDTDDLDNLIVYGNVGIGTAGPEHKLHIVGGDLALSLNNYLYLDTEGNPAYLRYVSTGTPRIAFGVDTTGEQVVITNSGNVGIGTTGPSSKLDIAGGITLSSSSIYSRWIRNVDNTTYLQLLGGSDGSSGGGIFIAGNSFAGVPTLGASDIAMNPGTDTGMMRFQTYSGTDLMVIKATGATTGNVGIGTTGPAAKLHVAGGKLRIENINALSDTGLEFWTDTYLWRNANQRLQTNRGMIIEGNVGIGTTGPAAKLDITFATGSDTAGSNLLQSFNLSSTQGMGYRYSADGIKLILDRQYGNWFPMMTFDRSSGNVGIGTTGPGAPLEVKASSSGASITGLLIRNNNTAVNTATAIKFYNSTSASFDGSSQIESIRTDVGASGTSDLRFSNWNGSVQNEIMRITGGGNVGIGTTGPINGKLEINQSLGSVGLYVQGESWFKGTLSTSHFNYGTTENTYLRGGKSGAAVYLNDNHNGNVYVVTGGGNVGIGTTGPGTILTIGSTVAPSGGNLQIFNTLANGRYMPTIILGSDSSSGASIGYDSASGGARFSITTRDTSNSYNVIKSDFGATGVGNNSALYITNTGNVGIGTTGPGYPLQIASSANAFIGITGENNPYIILEDYVGTYTEYKIQNTNGLFSIADDTADRMTIKSGNVGIGTTVPERKLHVYGSDFELADFQRSSSSGSGFRLRNTTHEINFGLGSGSAVFFVGVTGGADNFFAVDTNNFRVQSGSQIGWSSSATEPVSGAIDTYFYRNAANIIRTPGQLIIDGNVGIGTTGPEAKLHIYSNAAYPTGGYIADLEGTNAFGIIRFIESGTTRGQLGYADGNLFTGASANSFNIRAEGDLHLGGTGDNLTMTMKNGNVGIGTTTPTAKLEIAGTETNDGSVARITNTTATTGRGYKIISRNNGTADIVAAGSPDKVIASMGVK